MPEQLPHQKRSMPSEERQASRYQKRRMPLIGGLIGVALISGIARGWVASLLSHTSFMQSQFSSEDAEVFNQRDQLSESLNLQVPQLSRPTNILVLGTKVLTSEVADPSVPQEGYQALVNSLDGLADAMFLLRCGLTQILKSWYCFPFPEIPEPG